MVFVPGEVRPDGALCTQWATTADVCAPCDDLDSTLLDAWLEAASVILFGLTGSRWPGECVDTIHPTGAECMAWMGAYRPGGYLRGRPREFRLPGYPVIGIDSVTIDGEVLDPARYRVDDYRWLVYVPESTTATRQGWPNQNDVKLDAGEVGTWSIVYAYGTMPPPGGKEAAAALGCELAKSCTEGEGECRLPQRVTSITRQGVSMAILDPLTLFQDGLTGLPEVDLWVSAMNLARSRRPSTLIVPGRRVSVRRRGA